MREKFQDFNFSEKTLGQITVAQEIVEDYESRGYYLTLRQLYYQFIARNLMPNTERSYKNLGEAIKKARMAGLISWTSIEDRTRGASSWLIEEREEEAVYGVERRFALDLWKRQGTYVEIWVEKEALSDVVRRPAVRRRVPYLSCKGYLSASEAWRAGKRFKRKRDEGRRLVILHLGDHDPSGIDMTRDNDERVDLLSWQSNVEFRRIALNMDQIEQERPPENPAKLSDSRARDYIERFGRSSWELDALNPEYIDNLITSHLDELIDEDVWAETLREEDQRREVLRDVHRRWGEVSEFLRG